MNILQMLLFLILFLYSFLSVHAASPLQDGLSAWWKADYGVYKDINGTQLAGDGDDAMVWKDQISGIELKRYGVAPKFEENVLCGFPVLRFSGTPNEWMRTLTNVLPATDEYTMFVVTTNWLSGPPLMVCPYGYMQDEVAMFFRTGTSSSPLRVSHITNASFDKTYLEHQETDFSVPRIIEGVFGNISNDLMVRVDNTDTTQTSYGSGNQSEVHSSISRSVIVGYYNYCYDGDIAEILIYDHKLSEADRLKVGEYLAEKYNLNTSYQPQIAVPASGASGWWAADTGGYGDLQLTQIAGNDDSVMAWQDKIGKHQLIRYGISPILKTNSLYGHSVLRFSGATNEWMRTLDDVLPATDEYTMFVVTTNWLSGPPLMVCPYGYMQDEVAMFFRTGTSSSPLRVGHVTNTSFDKTYLEHQETDFSVPRIIEGVFGNISNDLMVRVNNTDTTQSTYSTGNQFAIHSCIARSVIVGYYNYCYDGDIAEILIYPWKMSESERAQTGSYLAEKYGIDNANYSASITPQKETIADSGIQISLKKIGNTITMDRFFVPGKGSFIPSEDYSPIWRARVRNTATGQISEVTSCSRTSGTALSESSGELTATWSEVKLNSSTPLFTAQLTIKLDASLSGLPTWELKFNTVSNDYTIYEVDFPVINVEPLSENGSNDYLVTSERHGRLIQDPFAMSTTLCGKYPAASQSLQLTALYSPGITGLYIASGQ